MRGAPKPENKWFKGKDNLAGTDQYGDVNIPEKAFSVKFDSIQYDQVSDNHLDKLKLKLPLTDPNIFRRLC